MTRPAWGAEEALVTADWAPIVDIQESDKEYLVKAELPEVKKDDVKVNINDGVLTLEGERHQEKEEKNKKFHRVERSYGKFVRCFTMPEDADDKKVQADFKDGVLNVHIGKSEAAKPKAIEVKVA
jgi:HSP20 family protein